MFFLVNASPPETTVKAFLVHFLMRATLDAFSGASAGDWYFPEERISPYLDHGLGFVSGVGLGYLRAMSNPGVQKSEVLAGLVAKLTQELTVLLASQRQSQEAATHEEAKPESDKDTRATESSYLARGLAARVADLQAELGRLESLRLRTFDDDAPIALTAWVTLEDEEGGRTHTFVAPAGGGTKLTLGARTIAVVTPGSPLGRALLGKQEGDDVELSSPSGLKSFYILRVV